MGETITCNALRNGDGSLHAQRATPIGNQPLRCGPHPLKNPPRPQREAEAAPLVPSARCTANKERAQFPLTFHLPFCYTLPYAAHLGR